MMQAANVDLCTDLRTRVAIVGGGPMGLELAVALTREGIDYELFEAKQIGHTMTWWAPQTRWFSSSERIAIAGVPLETLDQSKVTREQYLTYLRGIVRQFGLRVHTYEPVTDVQQQPDETFALMTSRHGIQRHVRCEAVVLAVGGTDFPRLLGIEGENLPHVDGYFREPHNYFDRRVLIVGGRNSAIEAALRVHHAGGHVALSYRQAELPRKSIKYWLLPEIEGLIQAGRITAHLGTRPVRIKPNHVTLERIESGERYDVPADVVLSLIGYEQDKRLLHNAGVELIGETQRPQFEMRTMQTNVPRLYVAGTAIAGTQSSHYRIFLENCHVHVERIVAHLQGRPPPTESIIPPEAGGLAAQIEAQPES